MTMDSMEDEGRQSLRDGTVTAIEPQKKNLNRVSVFIDGEFAFGLTADIAALEGIRQGRLLTVADQERVLAADKHAAARAMALNYLSRRSRTREEVRRKLARAEFDAAVIEAAIGRLDELGYLDDEEYARRYTEARMARRYGPHRIVRELEHRGISPEIADAAVGAAQDARNVDAEALALAEGRAARLQNEPDMRKRRKKLYDFLLRRGYSSDVARRVVDLVQESQWK